MLLMFQIRIWFVFFANLILFTHSLMGQEIRADLQKAYQDKDSLVVALTLKNLTNKPVYIVCGVNVLTFEDYYPDKINYGSFSAEIEARKKNQSVDRNGDIRDTINLVIPTTKERFQVAYNKSEKIDVFKTLSALQEVFNNKKMSSTVPIPPDDSVLVKSNYLDIDLYNLLQNENVTIDEGNFFYGQTVILGPKENKSFSIDLGYLLLRKATYQIRFDYKTDNGLFKKETSFLKCLGFQRFKGRITSNSLSVVSQ